MKKLIALTLAVMMLASLAACARQQAPAAVVGGWTAGRLRLVRPTRSELLKRFVGGTLMGLLGALVAIPVTASILLIIKKVSIPKQETERISSNGISICPFGSSMVSTERIISVCTGLPTRLPWETVSRVTVL